MNWENDDAVCCVLSNERQAEHVFQFLDYYFISRKILNSDYIKHPVNPSIEFGSEKEMLSYFSENVDNEAVFFWNGVSEKIKGVVLLGVNFTQGGRTIYSITLSANGESECEVLDSLKKFFNTDVAYISYNAYPEFESTEAFKAKCLN